MRRKSRREIKRNGERRKRSNNKCKILEKSKEKPKYHYIVKHLENIRKNLIKLKQNIPINSFST